MSGWKELAAFMAAGAILIAAAIYAQESAGQNFDFLSSGEFAACGLHKLTADEQAQLMSRMALVPMPSYCETSAEAYMKSDGYHKIRVLGATLSPKQSGRYTVYVWDKYKVTALEVPLGEEPLEPGLYWSDHDDHSSTWDIVYLDGKKKTFWEKH